VQNIAAMDNTIKKTSCLLSALLVFCAIPGHSQFFKDIVNRVKQTSQNRANDKAGQNTNKALDKVDSLFTPNGKSSGSRVDTTSGQATMKSLGVLMGGGGVSPEDSAKALAAYKTAKGGSGTYYEYAIESNTKRSGPAKTTSKMYFSNAGEGRSEMNIAAMMGAKNAHPMIIIGRVAQKTYSVSLDDGSKQYSLNVIDTGLINSGISTYKVTKIGQENVAGYDCIHVKLEATTGSGIFKSTSTTQLWTSTGVPGYSSLKRMMTQNITPAMTKALDDAGCGGFVVKMSSGDGKDYSMSMTLAKAEKQTFPSSLFTIPSGYTKSDDNLMLGNMMGAASKQ